MRPTKTVLAALAAASIFAGPANATTDGVCYRVVNVEGWDVLNIRARRSANSRVVGEIPPRGHGIIAKAGDCRPYDAPPGSRWCRISYYDGDYTARGFVKGRYLRRTECP